jgi:hypothetical protein
MTLERNGGAPASNLARVVMTLLLALGPGAKGLVEKHDLHRGLPLALLAGVPVWDRQGHDEERMRRPGAVPVVARRVAAFILDAADRLPMALIADKTALRDPLAAAVIALLRRSIARRGSKRSSTGGLLLAVS